MQQQPVATAAALSAATGLTPATVNKPPLHLQSLGMVSELTECQRGRVFAYTDCVALLNAELNTDPTTDPSALPINEPHHPRPPACAERPADPCPPSTGSNAKPLSKLFAMVFKAEAGLSLPGQLDLAMAVG